MTTKNDDLYLGLDDVPNHDEVHFANRLLTMHQQQLKQEREQSESPAPTEPAEPPVPNVSALGVNQERPSRHGLLRQKN